MQCEFYDEGRDGLIRGVVTVENTSNPSPDTRGYDSQFGADEYDPTLFNVTATLSVEDNQFYLHGR